MTSRLLALGAMSAEHAVRKEELPMSGLLAMAAMRAELPMSGLLALGAEHGIRKEETP